jgi:hypothetical protein
MIPRHERVQPIAHIYTSLCLWLLHGIGPNPQRKTPVRVNSHPMSGHKIAMTPNGRRVIHARRHRLLL